MKLTSLKSRLQTAGNRITTLAPVRPEATPRKRGWTGVNDRNLIRKRDCGLCQECKRQGKVSVGVDVDHIVPLWAGGQDVDANKELLCSEHHHAKSKREAAQRARGDGR